MRPVDEESELSRLCQEALARGDADAATALGRRLDALSVVSRPVDLVAAALWYAEAGLLVFPLRPGGKQPLPGSRGCKEATGDPARIRRWWTANPAANIGIATGHLVDVIDIDGPNGVKSWSAALEADGLPPVLGTVSTPRAGGTHLYVAADPKRRNGANLVPGVDQRARGGYVVAPPSVNAEGVRYAWRRPLSVSELVAQEVAA
jgi:hypothetical protein